MIRILLSMLLASGLLLGTAAAASACAPYTWDEDSFGLDRGVAWAFRGHVIREVPGEVGPVAMVIEVDRTLAGVAPSRRRLVIRQDQGCDGFVYQPGDEVIMAVPLYPPGIMEVGPRDRIGPPYRDLSNYGVAAWVIRHGQVVRSTPGVQSWADSHGQRPTVASLVARLRHLPDTAATSASVHRPGARAGLAGGLLPAAAGALALLLLLARRPRAAQRPR